DLPMAMVQVSDFIVERDGEKQLLGYLVQPGMAMREFLGRSVRWVGKFAAPLLTLTPREHRYAKQLGIFLSFRGHYRSAVGQELSFTPRHFFEWAGVDPYKASSSNPGQWLDRLQEAL